MARSFRLTNPRLENSNIFGRFVAMTSDIEYRKDEIHSPKSGRLSVQVPVEFIAMVANQDKVTYLLCYYAIEELKKSLSAPDPELEYQLEPSESEYKELLDIATEVILNTQSSILRQEYIRIDESLRANAKKIFISCGQYHPNEKEVGKQIKQIIDSKLNFEGYFAEDQQSFEGLTSNIFNALHNSVAFVAVMHRRDRISTPDPIFRDHYRGSVWIEQEIAIAAFMKQTLAMPIEVLAYIQDGIDLEGVRGLIILNPQKFSTDKDLIDDIKKSLPKFLEKIKPPETWETIG